MSKAGKIIRNVFIITSIAGCIWLLIPACFGVRNIGSAAGIFACGAVFAGTLAFPRVREVCGVSMALRRAVTAVLVLASLALLWVLVLTGLMLSERAAEPPKNAVVLVLGCMVNGTVPSAELQSRITAGAAYLNAHPQTVCIACGGRGGGEAITEAEAIRTGLVQLGVDSSRIILENTSKTTFENISNASALAAEAGYPAQFAVVTDGYHEFRACSIARRFGAQAYAVPAKTPWYVFSACWAREILALTNYLFFV